MLRRSMSGIVAVSLFILAVSAVAANDKKLTIGLIGDSTVASTYGWGPALTNRFNDHVTVLNYAKNGATLESLSKKLDELIKHKPDYILVQFGHNDMKVYDAKTYSAKLKDYVERIKRGGCKPIVLSSVTRRTFDEHGKIVSIVLHGDRSLPAFALSAKAVAKEEAVPFIDLNTISIEHHNKLGPEASAAYNFNKTDATHFSTKGAEGTAELILKELKAVVPELTAYLIDRQQTTPGDVPKAAPEK